MTELPPLAAADRFRLLQDQLTIRDEARAKTQRAWNRLFSDSQRQTKLIEADVHLGERRIQERRDIAEGDRVAQVLFRGQESVLDWIDNDEAFVWRRGFIEDELSGSRDGRELGEGVFLNGLEGDRNNTSELRSLDLRNKDLRQQLVEREGRIVERRIQERNDAIRQEADLRRSVERIRSSDSPVDGGIDASRGAIVDVFG